MALPAPVPGLVIRYSYLWRSEHDTGAEEGRKDRPCAIVASVRADGKGNLNILVLPITHTQPASPELALEIPLHTKARLCLDSERSWVSINEWNEFIWPGPDLRRVPGADDSSIAYGILPPSFFRALSQRFYALRAMQRAHRVLRTE